MIFKYNKLESYKKMYLMNFFISISLYFPIEVAYLNSLGFSVIEISIINLCLPLFIGILEIPTGHLGDIKSRKSIMIYAIACFALSLILLISFKNFIMIIIAYFFEGLGWSLASGNNEALLKDVSSENIGEFNSHLSRFYEFSFLATLTASILLVTITSFGYDKFKLLLFITLVIRLLAFVFGMGVKTDKNKINIEKSNVLSLAVASKKYLRDSTTLAIAVYEGIGRFQFFFPTIYQIALIANGFPIKYIAYINFGYVIFQFLVQRYSQYFIAYAGRKMLLLLLPILQAFLMLSLFTNNIILLSISIIVIYACIPLKTQIANEYKHAYIDDSNRSTYISIVSFVALSFSTVVFFIIGIVADYSNFYGKVIFILVLIIFSTLSVNKITRLDSRFEENTSNSR